ncbi:MAG: group III truncated hemoglobin [Saprospiraceae bacterium]|nr:group III truncated hemoglobin [Saprospiraceae bacterium]
MKTDIETRIDIEKLVNTFYNKAKTDELIGYIFEERLAGKWEHHLPTMYSFWASILLGEASYRGNVMIKHIELNKSVSLKKESFQNVGKTLFIQNIDDLFEGNVAEEAKNERL